MFSRFSSIFSRTPTQNVGDLLDAQYYHNRYGEIYHFSLEEALDHFITKGFIETLDPNEYFDCQWYLQTYRDVADKNINPIEHYFNFGRSDHRNPSKFFSTALYLLWNEDVRSAGINPLVHYIKYGRRERRPVVPIDFLPPICTPGAAMRDMAKSELFYNPALERFLADASPTDSIRLWACARSLLASPHAFDNSTAVELKKNVAQNKSVASAADFKVSEALYRIFSIEWSAYIQRLKSTFAVGGYEHTILEQDVSLKESHNYIEFNLWSEIFFVINAATADSISGFYLSDGDNFEFDLLSRLEEKFPISLDVRAIFIRMLHDELIAFVAQNTEISGGWGVISLKGRKLWVSLTNHDQKFFGAAAAE
ncbi:hypothetical protein KC799_12040 [candidate division KSB1 bacterium]|nr:hypothetical protein [candidate division KSB1 bacterium]